MEGHKDDKIARKARPPSWSALWVSVCCHEQIHRIPKENWNSCSPDVYLPFGVHHLFLCLHMITSVGCPLYWCGRLHLTLPLHPSCPSRQAAPNVLDNMRQHSQLTFPVKPLFCLVLLLISWSKLAVYFRGEPTCSWALGELADKRCFSWHFSWSEPLNVSLCLGDSAVSRDVDVAPW